MLCIRRLVRKPSDGWDRERRTAQCVEDVYPLVLGRWRVGHTQRHGVRCKLAGANGFVERLSQDRRVGRIVCVDVVEYQREFMLGEWCVVWNEVDIRNAIDRRGDGELDVCAYLLRHWWFGQSIGHGHGDVARSDGYVECVTE